MTKVGISITLDLDIIQKIKDEEKRSGKKASFLINYHLKKSLFSGQKPLFYACRLCGNLEAPEENGLCRKCNLLKNPISKKIID